MRVGSIESLTDLAQSYVGYAGADKLYYPGLYNAGSEDESGGEDHATKYNMYTVILGKGFAMHGSLLIMWTEYRI